MFQHGLHQHGHQTTQTHGAGVVPASDETVVVVPGTVTPGPPISVVFVGIAIGPVVVVDVVDSFGAVGTQIGGFVVVVDVVVVVVVGVSLGAVGIQIGGFVVVVDVVVVVDSFGAVGTDGVPPGSMVDVVVVSGLSVDAGGRGSLDAESTKL